MTKAIVLLLGILFFRAGLPRRERRTNTTITPYGSVFDVAVPTDLACSELCDPMELSKWQGAHGVGTPWIFRSNR
jgi:hypothetical protein